MIIRRRRNSGFTIIANLIFEDDRLSYEATGLLGYLLSRPDHWEVRPGQLAERRGIGRDRMRRMLGEMIDAGYIRREKVRDEETGAFAGDTYLVFDEPQLADPETVEPAPENPSLASDAFPSAGKPVAGLYKDLARTEDSTKTEEREVGRAVRKSKEEPPPDPAFDADLERLLADWPNTAVDDVDLATKAFRGLSGEERKAAIDAIPEYLVFHRQAKGAKGLVYLHNYIHQRKWTRLQAQKAANPAVAIAKDTVQRMCTPFERRSWLVIFRRYALGRVVQAGHAISAMIENRPFLAQLDELPTDGQEAEAAELLPDSPEWDAWRAYILKTYRSTLPTPHRAPRVYAPQRWPPSAEAVGQHAIAV